jgi:hypothetical protein
MVSSLMVVLSYKMLVFGTSSAFAVNKTWYTMVCGAAFITSYKYVKI